MRDTSYINNVLNDILAQHMAGMNQIVRVCDYACLCTYIVDARVSQARRFDTMQAALQARRLICDELSIKEYRRI